MHLPERRKHDRVPLVADLTIEDLNTGQSCPGRSINISRGGVSFFSAKCFPIGNEIRITLYLTSNGKKHRVQVHARIIHFSIETRGAITGAVFDTDLAPANYPLLCDLIDGR